MTAAYNEDANIEKTIESVLSQSQLPNRWVIMSDALLTELTKLLGRTATSTISRWGQLRERVFAVFRGNAARESTVLEKISRSRCVILRRTDSLAEPHNPSHAPGIPLFG